MNCFISYTQADLSWAEWIAWQLEESGLQTILQAWDFRAGCNFVLEMDSASKQAQRTIAVLSDSLRERRLYAPGVGKRSSARSDRRETCSAADPRPGVHANGVVGAGRPC